jgi:putative FmdB family regulatory protein
VPLYEYQCQPHNHRFEVRHGMNEEPVKECHVCGGPVRRVIHPVGIVFKGSGFYATDSRKAAEAKSEPAASATKKDTKAEKPSDSGSTSSGSTKGDPVSKVEPSKTG